MLSPCGDMLKIGAKSEANHYSPVNVTFLIRVAPSIYPSFEFNCMNESNT